jgi:hypothetical protein
MEKWMGCLEERSKKGHVNSYLMAEVYVMLGKKEQAFTWLEKAIEVRDPAVVRMRIEPTLDNLRSDPRFVKLLQRINLKQ